MGLEPHVNALHMKHMVAFGQKPRLFTFRDLTQTHRAFEHIVEHLRIKQNNRYGFEDTKVQTTAGNCYFLVAGGKIKAVAPGGGGGGGLSAALPEPSGVEVKANNKDHNKENKHNCYNHYLPCDLKHACIS